MAEPVVKETPARFRAVRDVVARDIEGGLLLVNLQTGGTWRLNAVGAEIYRRLEAEGGADASDLVGALGARYGVGDGVLRRDIDGLLAELRREGLVEATG